MRFLPRRFMPKTNEIEFTEQVKVASWLRLQKPEVLFTASANGARTSLRQGVKLKVGGVQAGTPDLLIFEPRGPYHGLLIEMKRPAIRDICVRGVASKEQRDFLDKAKERGYYAAFCYGADEAITLIIGYLAILNIPESKTNHDSNRR